MTCTLRTFQACLDVVLDAPLFPDVFLWGFVVLFIVFLCVMMVMMEREP